VPANAPNTASAANTATAITADAPTVRSAVRPSAARRCRPTAPQDHQQQRQFDQEGGE